MRVLMFLHDAYGGHGGISRNNRDVLDALVEDRRVEQILALPRIAGDRTAWTDGIGPARLEILARRRADTLNFPS